MDPLDQVFKNQLRDHRAEFQDAYWLQAEKLIAARERRRRWRKFAFWLILAVVLFSLSFLWLWPGKNEMPAVPPAAVAGHSAGTGNQKKDQGVVPVESLAPTGSQQAGGFVTAKPENDDSQKTSAKDRLNIREVAAAMLPPSGTTVWDDREGTVNKERKAIERRERENRSPAFVAPGSEEKREKTILATAAEPPGVAPGERISGPALFVPVMLSAISPGELAAGGDTGIAPKRVPASLQPVSRLYLDLTFAGTVYPYLTATDRQVVGWRAGLQGRLSLGGRWQLLAAFAYRQRWGTFFATQGNTAGRLSFGRTESQQFLLPERLHYLEVPVGISCRLTEHTLQAGGGISYLLGVRGSLQQTHDDELQWSGSPSEERQRGWLATDGFREWSFQLWLGYQYEFTPRTAAGFRWTWTPGTILAAGYEGPEDTYLREAKPLFLELGLRYQIK